MDFASRGKEALADKKAHLAVELFTRALIEHPTSPHFYTQRSIAYARLKSEDGGPDYLASFKDAKLAEHLAQKRGSRELVTAAQMRRAIALYHLEYYADAHALFETIETRVQKPGEQEQKRFDPYSLQSDKRDSIKMELPTWKMKTAKKLQGLSEEDLKKSASVLESQDNTVVPDVDHLKAELAAWLSGKSVNPAAGQAQQSSQPATDAEAPSATQTNAANQAPTTSAQPTVEKVRHDWYQTASEVLITLYVKNVPEDKVESDFDENTLSIQFPLPSGATYDFSVDPLYAPINVPNSKVKVMQTKIEITLSKSSNMKWHTLESTNRAPLATRSRDETPQDEPKKTNAGPTAFSKVVDDENDSDASDNGDSVDSFFKSLYAKADPDTRRAMMKSYVESNGTALSTNWGEVGTKKVEEHPPN